MNETQIVEWGKAFRKELPDPKVRKLFDQYIRYKSNPKSGIPEDKLLTKSEAIEEAITYYSIKYEVDIPNIPDLKSKDKMPEEVVDMDKFTIPAKGGAGRPTSKELCTESTAVDVITNKTEKKTKSRRKKTDESEEPIKVKPGPKPKKKAITTAAPPPPPELKPTTNLVATFLEKEMETLHVEDVEIIHLTPFEYDGKKFYRNEKKGKIYQIGKNSSVGPYIGRWNYRTSTIETDIPDSDSE